MSQYVAGRSRTFQASAALSQYRRVHLNGSFKLEYCSAAHTDGLGTLGIAAVAADQYVPVTLITAQGTQVMVASGAISAEAAVYAAASGKIASTGTVLVGEALQAATADGDLIEVLPIQNRVGTTTGVQNIPLHDFRVHDAMATNLPGTAATDDLALIAASFGTDGATLECFDPGAVNASATSYARVLTQLPPDYVASGTLTLRIRAGIQTTVPDVTCDLDAEVHEIDGDGGVGADLCATAAQDMIALTADVYGNFDFTITDAGLAAGDSLDIRISITTNDEDTATVIIPTITKVELRYDSRP